MADFWNVCFVGSSLGCQQGVKDNAVLCWTAVHTGTNPAMNLKALSHQTSSHYILQNWLRTGRLPEYFEQFQSSGLFRKFLARSGSSYYVQETCTQFKSFGELVWCEEGVSQLVFVNVRLHYRWNHTP